MSRQACLTLLICALLSTAPAAAAPKEPENIYAIRGDADQLKRFHAEIGKEWTGGKFLDRLSTGTEHRYWAYSTRSAREARTFMFGSINHQLRLGFEAFVEATYYPKERAFLDHAASLCQLTKFPPLIEPDGTVVVRTQTDSNPAAVDCLRAELKKSSLGQEMPVRMIGNVDHSERG